jgi:hypothetical protein
MTFRGSDLSLDHEIETVELIVRVRLRRYSREMLELERDLRALKRERARRRAGAEASVSPTAVARETASA